MDEILEKLIDIDVSTQKITDEWNKKWDNSEKYVEQELKSSKKTMDRLYVKNYKEICDKKNYELDIKKVEIDKLRNDKIDELKKSYKSKKQGLKKQVINELLGNV